MTTVKNWLLATIKRENNGVASQITRGLLYLLSLVYLGVTRYRNWSFEKRWRKTTKVDAAVVSIGNLTTGGTGKTPLVIWLTNQFQADYPTAVISRGYKSAAGKLNDEGMEIDWQTGGVLQIQNRNRVAACLQAIKQLKHVCVTTNRDQPLILLDDAFQHRAIARDLDVVLIDATNPFGYEHVLPRGLLRESLYSIRRATFAVLTRANHISPAARTSIKRRIVSIAPNIGWAEVRLVADGWSDLGSQRVQLDQLSGKKVLAFCGIGNSTAFEKTLAELPVKVCKFCPFDDHHQFSDEDITELVDMASQFECDAIVCTAKDLVKVRRLKKVSFPVLALMTKLEFLNGSLELKQHVQAVLSD